jgi:hypothetical protein
MGQRPIRLGYSPLTAALTKIGQTPGSFLNTDTKTIALENDAGLRMVGDVAAAAVAVEAEETTWADIDIVNENHAVSLQQEGEHRTP